MVRSPASEDAKRYDTSAVKQNEQSTPVISAAIMAVGTPISVSLGVYYELSFLSVWPFIYALSLLMWFVSVSVMPTRIGIGWLSFAVAVRVISDLLYGAVILYCLRQDPDPVRAFGLMALVLGLLVNSATRQNVPILILRDRVLYGALFLSLPVGFWVYGLDLVGAVFIGWISVLIYCAFLYSQQGYVRERPVTPAQPEGDIQRQKLEALGQLTGGVAHDFNNLLTVILGNVDMLRDAPSDETAKELLGEIDDAAHRAAALTSQLLSFARKQQLAPEPTQVQDILSSGLTLLRRLLPATHHLDVVVGPDCPAIYVDRPHLQTVLVNLVINARDAMPEGGVITLSMRRHELQRGYRPKGTEKLSDGSYLAIAITDKGAGIADADMARVLEPFYTTKAPGKGSGLGLSTALGFAEQTGGTLSLSSTVNVGTRAALWFPAHMPDDMAEAAATDAHEKEA